MNLEGIRKNEREEDFEEGMPKMKSEVRFEMLHEGSGQRKDTKIFSRSGKETSRKWSDSYNIQELGSE